MNDPITYLPETSVIGCPIDQHLSVTRWSVDHSVDWSTDWWVFISPYIFNGGSYRAWEIFENVKIES